MKKLISLAIVVMMVCSLSLTSFAAKTDVTNNYEVWTDICHVSYDHVYPEPSAVEGEIGKMLEKTVPAEREDIKLFGWIACAKPIQSFSYSINGGEMVYDDVEPENDSDLPDFKFATEQGVLDAPAGKTTLDGRYPDRDNGGITRFYIIVPLQEGSQLVEASVNYTDGTSEIFWALVASRGTPTDISDIVGIEPDEGGNGEDEPVDTEEEPGVSDTAEVIETEEVKDTEAATETAEAAGTTDVADTTDAGEDKGGIGTGAIIAIVAAVAVIIAAGGVIIAKKKK